MSDYAESKMADVQFTYELQRRLLHAGIDKYPVGGTLKMATEKELCERVCKKQACAIQFCLQRRNYQESKCAEVIKRYYDCCAAAKEAEQKTRTTSS
ncbi:hypothetical protein PC119_g134 [Phytophthora cactorum]|nr:hypothetical protein PC114_g483 [Phytophthora cactorum]KAG2941745.1 hypothetical protein PC115_g1807 [Phytophthora cactorum]KAG2950851.1 hypothetical protein PC117_g4096 [Phytophthora cactorum]KAG3042360.1 hypothetical protein PC119_g134 [Phytophthora cactorum]KAG3207190.1 hypothetical protein PC128_g180 [Phytophthora cactorum]